MNTGPLSRLMGFALALALGGAAAGGAAEGDAAAMARVERYLNGITTLKADFLQVAHDGSVGEGTLFISRPGKLRLEYAPPLAILLVSDGEWLTYIDRELGQVSQTPLNTTPAGMLLRESIEFGRDAIVTRFERANAVLRITLVQPARPDEGSLTLVFSEEPLELRQWFVVDPQGLETRITLFGTRLGLPLNPELFAAPPPFPDDDGNGR